MGAAAAYVPPEAVQLWADKFRALVQIPESSQFLDYDTYLAQCWLWIGKVQGDGQAFICVRGQRVPIHRFAYQLWVGPVPDRLFARPKVCGTKLCVCPHHLRLRAHGGGNAKLTDQQRKDIRWLYYSEHGKMPALRLAEMFGVSEQRVYQVLKHRDG